MKKGSCVILLVALYFVMMANLTAESRFADVSVKTTLHESMPCHNKVWTPAQEQDVIEWHHDCSNITGFAYQNDESWVLTSLPYFSLTEGSIHSSGSYIYPTSIGPGGCYSGPLYYLSLDTPLKMSHFLEFRAAIEIGSTSANQMGRIHVGLNDENGVPIAGLHVEDAWGGEDATLPQALWMFRNRGIADTNVGTPDRIQGSYDETLRLWQNCTGIYVSLPLVGVYKIIGVDQIDTSRMISYVTIQTFRWRTFPACSVMRIHDIVIETSLNPIVDKSPPSFEKPPHISLDVSNESGILMTITWKPYDENPAFYKILKDDISIRQGLWNSTAESISITIDVLSYGTWNYTVVAYDLFGNSAYDSIIIVGYAPEGYIVEIVKIVLAGGTILLMVLLKKK